MSQRLLLQAVNAHAWAVCTAEGQHVGNLKRIGDVWKFKAVGYGADGATEPGGGPLTDQHNMVFTAPDQAAVDARLGPWLRA